MAINKKRSTIIKMFYNLSIVESRAKELEKKLRLAGVPDNPRKLAAKSFAMLFFSIIGSVLLAILGFFFLLKFRYTGEHIFVFVSIMTLMLAAFLPVIAYLISIIDVSHRINVRKVGSEAETPAFSALFLVFLRSGISPKLLFENVSESATFTYISEIALYISKRIQYFGESIEKALSEARKTIPSDIFNKLITAYITAVETGAPVYETMQAKVRDIMKELELKASTVAGTLMTLGEGYITWLSSGFVVILLMLILKATYSTFASLPLGFLGLMAVILLPVVNLVFIWAVDQVQLRFPEKPPKANRLFIYMFPLGFVLGIVFMIAFEEIISKLPGQIPVSPEYMIIDLITLNGNTSMIPATMLGFSAGFLIVIIPSYLSAKKEVSTGTGYDQYVATFLRAVAEGLRSGLSPEKVLESLKDAKELGKFSDVLERIDALLKVGYPLKDAFRKASEIIRDFSTRIAFLSLADMSEIGSLVPETVEILAEQIETQVRIRREYYARIKVLRNVLYVGSIIVLVTTVLLSSIIFSLIHSSGIQSSSFLLVAQVLVPRAIYIISVASVFNALTTGLLIGKMSTGRVSDGFFHAGLLIVLTTALILVSLAIRFTFIPSTPPTF